VESPTDTNKTKDLTFYKLSDTVKEQKQKKRQQTLANGQRPKIVGGRTVT